jgi:hypothetical protein
MKQCELHLTRVADNHFLSFPSPVELETARTKRKEIEADFAKTKADLEHQLAEALAENEVWLSTVVSFV